MTFIIGIIQFHCKNEPKQLKWNEIKEDMCKSDSTFPYLQNSTLFKALLMRELIYTYPLNLLRKIKEKNSEIADEKNE